MRRRDANHCWTPEISIWRMDLPGVYGEMTARRKQWTDYLAVAQVQPPLVPPADISAQPKRRRSGSCKRPSIPERDIQRAILQALELHPMVARVERINVMASCRSLTCDASAAPKCQPEAPAAAAPVPRRDSRSIVSAAPSFRRTLRANPSAKLIFPASSNGLHLGAAFLALVCVCANVMSARSSAVGVSPEFGQGQWVSVEQTHAAPFWRIRIRT
jgi:hypothetical protein